MFGFGKWTWSSDVGPTWPHLLFLVKISHQWPFSWLETRLITGKKVKWESFKYSILHFIILHSAGCACLYQRRDSLSVWKNTCAASQAFLTYVALFTVGMVHIFSFYPHSITLINHSHRSLSPPAEVDVGDGRHAVRLEEPLHASERQFCREKLHLRNRELLNKWHQREVIRSCKWRG